MKTIQSLCLAVLVAVAGLGFGARALAEGCCKKPAAACCACCKCEKCACEKCACCKCEKCQCAKTAKPAERK
jgi:hypothetical protein